MIFPTPFDFGCKANGSDDTAGLQRWLDEAGTLYGPPGVFCHKWPHLTFRDGTDLIGAGPHSFILKNIGWNGIVQADSGARVRIQGVGFHGLTDLPLPNNAEFVTFAGTVDSLIRDCAFAHRRGHLLVLVDNVNLRVESPEFYDWGVLKYSGPVAGYAGGCAIFCQRANYNLWITNPYVHDGAGGIWLPVTDNTNNPQAENCILSGFQIFNVIEFGVVGAPICSDIGPGIICGVRRLDVSGHGAEMHGTDYSYHDVVTQDCDASGAYFSNVERVSIHNNKFYNVDRTKEGNRAIVIASHPPPANVGLKPPRHVTIAGNTGEGGILIADFGGGKPKDILCKAGMNNVGKITGG